MKKKKYRKEEELPKIFTVFNYSESRLVEVNSLRKENENSGNNEKDLN